MRNFVLCDRSIWFGIYFGYGYGYGKLWVSSESKVLKKKVLNMFFINIYVVFLCVFIEISDLLFLRNK